MEPLERSRTEGTIMALLYPAFFSGEMIVGLLDFRDNSGIEETEFDKIVDDMDERGLIRAATMGYGYKITPAGILYAENNKLVPDETIVTNRNARTTILDELAKVYANEGKLGSMHFQTIADNAGIDSKVIVYNMIMLEEAGYANAVTAGFSSITNTGLDAVTEWKKRLEIVSNFEHISKLKPQLRGVKLQDLIAEIAEGQGWEKEVSVKTSNEELDIVIYRGRDFFLVECKWEKEPIETKDLREFYAKLATRDGVKGMFISMSGFTGGAKEAVLAYMNNRSILLFGEGDVNSLVYENVILEDLINEKLKQLLTKKAILVK